MKVGCILSLAAFLIISGKIKDVGADTVVIALRTTSSGKIGSAVIPPDELQSLPDYSRYEVFPVSIATGSGPECIDGDEFLYNKTDKRSKSTDDLSKSAMKTSEHPLVNTDKLSCIPLLENYIRLINAGGISVGNGRFTIYDTHGRVVARFALKPSVASAIWLLKLPGNLPTGVYYYRLGSDDRILVSGVFGIER